MQITGDKLMFRILLTIAIASASAVSHASQTYKGFRCDSCYSQSDYNERAIQNGMPGFRYIFNLNSGVIKKFYLEQNYGGVPYSERSQSNTISAPPGANNWIATEILPEFEVVDFIQQLSQLYHQLGGTLHYHGELTIERPSTITAYYSTLPQSNRVESNIITDIIDAEGAYVFANNGGYRNHVMDNIRSNLNQNGSIATLRQISGSGGVNLGVIRLDMSLQAQTSVTYDIKWEDGSSLQVKLNKQTGEIDYVDGSLRDSNGMTIPDNSHIYPSGNWRSLAGAWEPSNLEAWLNEAYNRGISIVRGSGTIVICGTVNGGPLQCTVHPR